MIARSGNTLTVRGATLFLNDGQTLYINTPDAVVILGPSTIVTADDNPALTGLNYNSVAVGQHIIARGIYELPASGVTTLDATGNSSTNTGSVRLISTQLWGPLVSSATGSLAMNLQTIDNWPVSNYDFTGKRHRGACELCGQHGQLGAARRFGGRQPGVDRRRHCALRKRASGFQGVRHQPRIVGTGPAAGGLDQRRDG